MIIFDSDDFGCNHEISDACQSHDCRDVLEEFHEANPLFKVTLFAIPGEMTQELLDWSILHQNWVELAVHGFFHESNYECEKMSYEEFEEKMEYFYDMIEDYFVKGFKAPGWQISDGAYNWLEENGWWVADQNYNNDRRPKDLPVYIIGASSLHTHTWNCVGNGVYEIFDELLDKIQKENTFKFVSEAIQ